MSLWNQWSEWLRLEWRLYTISKTSLAKKKVVLEIHATKNSLGIQFYFIQTLMIPVIQWNVENVNHYDFQTFTNELNFSIVYPIRSSYAVQQINQTKPNQVKYK